MFKKYIYILSTLAIFSCDDIVKPELNVNPNNPTSAPYENILTGSEVGNIVLQTGETARRAGILNGYYTGIDRQYEGVTNYQVTADAFDALWDDAFVNTLRNAKVARTQAEEEGVQGVAIGITQLLEAMALGTSASLYGDIPFDEAGELQFENPVYEDQTIVYDKLQTLLDEAINNLSAGTGVPPSGSEIYFNGNATKWIEVAYSLKARYYMHTKEYANALAAAQLGISSLESSLMAPHAGSAIDNSNLTWQLFFNESRGADLVVSDFMISLVNPDDTENPNPMMYRGNAKTDETGRYNYYFQNNDIGFQPNDESGSWAARDADAPIITYEENLLTIAEATLRTGTFDQGLTALNEYRAFMNGGGYMNLDPADVTYEAYVEADFQSGGIENPDGISQDDALLREILEERYITLFGQIEGFNDMRRTINESIVRVPVQPNTGNELPQRFIYPQSEIDRNSSTPDPIPGLFDPTPVNQ
ncbi:SusD/RagB family nutrient-binding outer membrane lipoprotein [Mangrovivirga sp. M17]|uniref:SusD/RagB family nutrient-binding outer membrane lipoprotein n=1 Tax=Mangrovivirga halotolerans TaxID=2993936 RepID=A0ABT3RPB6_9BACT|nr:SusD/RagB family nutrient-binding outer membrane lipoprotein [Mangrovivirga halotolerans]MCX2743636.1 SusD/RagB family nutrient-binding outer membrane lipoprotein [Mangrovivirga halotolerans]